MTSLVFAWSRGPLGWLIPSETFPFETRSAGQNVTVFVKDKDGHDAIEFDPVSQV